MKQNFFGTDGIRNTMGAFPFELDTLPTLGRAIGLWALRAYNKQISILIGHDTRVSCALVKSSLKSGILLYGHTIYDAQTVPTPAVCLLTKKENFDLGIVISASHNPYHDNGIKIIDKKGKISAQDEKIIEQLYHELVDNKPVDYSALGMEHTYDSKTYRDYLKHHFSPQFLKGLTIVLDCAQGATYQIAPDIFESFGAQVITINNNPTGFNINNECGSLNPKALQAAVIEFQADIGFAFDGDGDRVIACNKHGQVKDGDDLLALLIYHPLYNKNHLIVGTIMTNQGFEQFLKKQNIEFLRTKVGDKYVLEELQKNNVLMGGEPSGHIILRDYMNTGDGIFTALRVIEAVQHTNNWHLETFYRYPQLIINVPVNTKIDLNQQSVRALVERYTQELTNGRIVIRYSGTENILRVMVESACVSQTELVTERLTESLKYEHTLVG